MDSKTPRPAAGLARDNAIALQKHAIGQPVRRKEDDTLVRGKGRYTDDFSLPGQAHAWMVRSAHAHGVIRAIDIDAARQMPGVLGIYVASPRQRGEMLGFFVDMARGRWRDSQHVEVLQAASAILKVSGRTRRSPAVMDGELVRLEPVTHLEIHPGVLNVLVPGQSA